MHMCSFPSCHAPIWRLSVKCKEQRRSQASVACVLHNDTFRIPGRLNCVDYGGSSASRISPLHPSVVSGLDTVQILDSANGPCLRPFASLPIEHAGWHHLTRPGFVRANTSNQLLNRGRAATSRERRTSRETRCMSCSTSSISLMPTMPRRHSLDAGTDVEKRRALLPSYDYERRLQRAASKVKASLEYMMVPSRQFCAVGGMHHVALNNPMVAQDLPRHIWLCSESGW